MSGKKANVYTQILLAIFKAHHKPGTTSFRFKREEIAQQAKRLKLKLPKNIGDLVYTFRYRQDLPAEIVKTAPKGREWVIAAAGTAIYEFKLARIVRILPAENQYVIKIPDATPELVTQYALSDEQALLAKVRYNRLVDIFLRVTAYSLQNHLRTTAPGIGQMETDEVYVGVRNTGEQFIIPVQAKGGKDQLGPVQIEQDMAMCAEKYPQLACRPVAVQFASGPENQEIIVMFELIRSRGSIKVLDQRHYCLVPGDEITEDDLRAMSS